MLPFLLAATGGYLIGNSLNSKQYANGGLANKNEARYTDTFYHGSTDTGFGGKNGIHIGTKLAATQALQSRIGVPAEGEWDGKRTYKTTKLAGKKTLARREKEEGYYLATGFNVGSDVPEEDYYPEERKQKAAYSDRTPIDPNSKPVVFPVKIVGSMNNTQRNPKSDVMANSLMIRQLKKNQAKNGYFYVNEGEDAGSISAVVPNGSWLRIL